MMLQIEFQCTKCGDCCRNPGVVYLTPADEKRFRKALLDVHIDYLVTGEPIIEGSNKGKACPMLVNNQCSIYEHRPTQCRSFPFWPQFWISKSGWHRANCEGLKVVWLKEA